MGGRSRGISPILNYGRSATIAQRGTTICGSEAGRRHRSAPSTCAPTNPISVRNPSGFAACWNGPLGLCAGKMRRSIARPWQSSIRRQLAQAAPDGQRRQGRPTKPKNPNDYRFGAGDYRPSLGPLRVRTGGLADGLKRSCPRRRPHLLGFIEAQAALILRQTR
jgi:hypothetical protein